MEARPQGREATGLRATGHVVTSLAEGGVGLETDPGDLGAIATAIAAG